MSSQADGLTPPPPPLKGRLYKRHNSPALGTLFNTCVRTYEVDDCLSCLLAYNSDDDFFKKSPSRIYPLGAMAQVSPTTTTHRVRTGLIVHVVHLFNISFSTPFSHTGKRPSSHHTLVLGSLRQPEADMWISGLSERLSRHRDGGAGLALEPSQLAASPPSRYVALKPFRHLLGHDPELSRHREEDLKQAASEVGVTVRNLDSSPYGVEIVSVEPGSAASEAELRCGEVIVAVNSEACLSYKHACKLLDGAARKLATNSEVVDLVVASKPQWDSSSRAQAQKTAKSPTLHHGLPPATNGQGLEAAAHDAELAEANGDPRPHYRHPRDTPPPELSPMTLSPVIAGSPVASPIIAAQSSTPPLRVAEAAADERKHASTSRHAQQQQEEEFIETVEVS